MHRRALASTIALALSLSVAATTTLAAPLSGLPADGVKTTKGKLISFKVRNDSGTALTLVADKKEIALRTGETIDLKLPVGTQVRTSTATESTPAGAVVMTVGEELKDSTVAIR